MIKGILTLMLLYLLFSSCGNIIGKHECYDHSLVHDNGCTTDCPGFKGCDGNIYCNECEAAKHGIGPK